MSRPTATVARLAVAVLIAAAGGYSTLEVAVVAIIAVGVVVAAVFSVAGWLALRDLDRSLADSRATAKRIKVVATDALDGP